MLGNQRFLPLACAVDDPNELDITSLKMSDRTPWMAHIFTYRLHDGILGPNIVTLFEFIRFCLFESSSLAAVGGGLFVTGLVIMGLRVDRQHLSRLDKRGTIEGCFISRVIALTALQCKSRNSSTIRKETLASCASRQGNGTAISHEGSFDHYFKNLIKASPTSAI